MFLEGDFGIDLATGVISNNFKLTDKVEKFREKYSGDGWWNGTADIIGGELMQGAYQLLKKSGGRALEGAKLQLYKTYYFESR